MANIHYRTQKASDRMDKPLTGETDQTTSQTTDNTNRPNVTDTRGKSAHRIALLRAYMREHNLDGLLIRTTSNIMWLSAFDDVFDDEQAHCVLLTQDGAVLHTDSRYYDACVAAAQKGEAPLSVSMERAAHGRVAINVLKKQHVSDDAFVLGIEDTMTLREYQPLRNYAAFELPRLTLHETSNVVLNVRGVKDASEIARLQAAQDVTDAGFSHIISWMKPGMTEREVQIELEDYMIRHGASGLAFRSIVAAGANAATAHAVPGDTKLEAGQCVVMDFGASAYGYCSDMTRCVFLGEPSAKIKDAYTVLRRANETVEARLHVGMTGKEAHEMAEQILAEGGYKGRMGHSLGHGVGIDIHEEPVLAPRNEQPLVEGNVVTVEPGIYIPGEFGMRLEDCGVLTHESYKVFGKSTHEMVII